MRTNCIWLMALATFLTLAVANEASAHVVVSPEEVPSDSFEKLIVRVPTEKDIPTSGVRVEVPEGFTVLGVQPVPGWNYEFEEEAGVIEDITWSGGQIRPQEFQEFAFQARTPDESGEFSWNAYQTYEDGSVVEWTGPEDTEEPASVVRVAAGGAGSDEQGAEAEEENNSENAASMGVIVPFAAYGGLGVGILALIVALMALLRKR